MSLLGNQFELSRCPHCGVDKPSLIRVAGPVETDTYDKVNPRIWSLYACKRCGGVVTAGAFKGSDYPSEQYPSTSGFHEIIPARARNYLTQAADTLHAPSASIVMSASAVDAMLKEKGYKGGTLYNRIEQAAKDHVITNDMAKWAHQVRLDANDERHADEAMPPPTTADAKKCLEFSSTLAQFLFVLPAQVNKGIKDSEPKPA